MNTCHPHARPGATPVIYLHEILLQFGQHAHDATSGGWIRAWLGRWTGPCWWLCGSRGEC